MLKFLKYAWNESIIFKSVVIGLAIGICMISFIAIMLFVNPIITIVIPISIGLIWHLRQLYKDYKKSSKYDL